MSNSFSSSVSAASVSAVQVGSYFVQQYYQVLQQQPEFVHRFYTDASTMVRVDGESKETATAIFQIHTLIQSLNFSGIEIKTINSLESWSEGVLVAVSGSVKSKYFSGWRKFVQTFFLAPQEKGYFVMNDVFHFVSEEVVVQHPPVPVVPENKVDSQPIVFDSQPIMSQPVMSSPPPELAAVTEDALEVEARENLNSINIEENDPDDYYTSQELQQQQEDLVTESFEEETPAEEPPSLLHNAVDYVNEPVPVVEEPIGEPVKLTYASILRAPKSKSAPSVPTQPSVSKSTSPAPEWHQTPEPIAQQSVAALPFVPDSTPEVIEEGSSHEDEGQSKSVYVRNLPSTLSTHDIFQEFKNFGKIKQDGVFLKNRQDVGVCFAFVEFEDVESVHKAIEASPIQLAGRQVYIEERRTNINSSSRGGRGRGGRGRGSYQYDSTRGRYGVGTYGRGGYQDGRGNGFRSQGHNY